MFDVIIIGGGTSGLMASIAAANQHAKVLLLEKNGDLGKKLLLTGGGRCNVTNNRPTDEIIQHIPGNGKFLYSAFSQFDNYAIIDFFKNNGVNLKEEDHGRLFPTTDSAKTIRDTFIELLKKYHVDVRTKAVVKQLLQDNGTICGVELTDGTCIFGRNVVVATGGKSIPRTGSTGDGYAWAKHAGHTITPLFPTEVPLTSNEKFIQQKILQGLSLRNIALSVLNQKGKTIITHQMDMLFTHFGISGPAVLRCSSFVYKERQKSQDGLVVMQLDCLPNTHLAALEQFWQHQTSTNGNKTLKVLLKQLIPERLALYFMDALKLPHDLTIKQCLPSQLAALNKQLKSWQFSVNGSLPLEKSFVTGGGVHLKEIDPKTMMSKYIKGLFFCGEILDIHGYTGGYNITSAFVTGHIAGTSAALMNAIH